VRAERCPAGQRLVARLRLGGLSVTQETLLWDGSDLVEFRTNVSGAIGQEHLLRVRFPAVLPGALPVYQTATAVIGRPFGAPEADVAEHWWTLENPANHWFGVGSVARASLPTDAGDVSVALGVAEVITPDLTPAESRPAVRDLLTRLGRAGVTATCSRSSGTRYGSVDLDSNLPDFALALRELARPPGRPDVEADDDRVRGDGQVHVVLRDGTHAAADDPELHLLADVELEQRVLQGFHRAGHVALDDQQEFFALAGLQHRVQVFQRDTAAALGERGLDLAIVYLPPPLDPAVLTPLADALSQLA